MGIFDITGGAGIEPGYEIASPIFDKITIELNKSYYSGKEFVIETKNNSYDNYYIDKAELNNKPLNSYKISHQIVTKGGTLKLFMSNKPNKNWGTK